MFTTMRFTRTALLVAMMCCFSLLALPVGAKASPHAAAHYIQALGDEALAIISNKALSKNQKQSKLETLFANSVDFDWVARFVIGRYWRQASEEQKSRYVQEYKKFLTLHYTSRFTDYTSGSFKVTDIRDMGEGEYMVSMELKSDEKSNDPPVFIDYRIRSEQGHFKIIDVVVEGVSLITTQRSEFASVIAHEGMDYLINQLAAKSETGDITP